VSAKAKSLVSPGAKVFFSNPRSCFGGELGMPMYSWATSAPGTVPVFVTEQFTLAIMSNR